MSTADVTGLLQAWSDGDAEALACLAPLVHRELRELARRMETEAGGGARVEVVSFDNRGARVEAG